MPTLYVLDVENFRPVIEVAAALPGVVCRRVGDYAELSAEGEITIDRRATGVNHAAWYSTVAGVADGRVVQQDKDALRVVPA
ncbi:MAG TPA: hypothetical protein VG034_03580 [Acidimicrobiia bacterium]|jgi:hypothetical protein|nr:hypothetical protein [Acidimicrobiia bacterium]